MTEYVFTSHIPSLNQVRVQLLEHHTLETELAVSKTLVSFPREVLTLSSSVLCGGSKKPRQLFSDC